LQNKITQLVLTSLIILSALLAASNMQTFFIYEDSGNHPLPADKACVALVALEGDSTQVVAYAGAIWGSHDLSGRDYCIAWVVRPSDDFDDWLNEQGYRRKPGEPE